jgi:hypothetical protein
MYQKNSRLILWLLVAIFFQTYKIMVKLALLALKFGILGIPEVIFGHIESVKQIICKTLDFSDLVFSS